MSAEAYNLGASTRYVQELYPVLLDAHGNVIDGNSRLDAKPSWRTETHDDIQTPAQLWAARIIANGCRRTVSQGERREQFSEFARCLVEEEVPKDQVVATISKITTFSERYIQLLLPAEYKRTYKSDLRSQLAQEGQFTVPAAEQPRGRPAENAGPGGGDRVDAGAADPGKPEPQEDGSGLLPRLPPGAQARPEDGAAAYAPRIGGAPVARGEARQGTPGPDQLSAPNPASAGAGAPGYSKPEKAKEEALEHIRRYFDAYPKPDPEFLSWEAAIKTGVSEKEAVELIGQVRRERGAAEPRREAKDSVTCPLCSRDGAERSAILSRVRDPQFGQLTLWEFVMEALP